MVEIDIPGVGVYEIEHLVTNVKGTLAVDGQLMDGVAEKATELRK